MVGAPDEAARAGLKQSLEDTIQRRLRFRAEVRLYAEGELTMEYGSTGKVKLVEDART